MPSPLRLQTVAPAALLVSICLACAGAPEQSFTSASAGATSDDPASSGGESGPSESSTTTADPTQGSEDSGDPQSCCAPHDAPGCDEPDVRACVCGLDAVCCVSSWDDNCVTRAMIDCEGCGPGGGEAHGDTTMGVGDGTGTTSAGESSTAESDDGDSDGAGGSTGTTSEEGACCAATEGVAGCADETIEQCVCAMDQFCCNEHWDYLCVQEAASACAADCSDDCCETHEEPGCLQHSVTMCVCDFDPFCCNNEWDPQCLDEAMDSCGLRC
ncbi:MAG TPA: hypothetical protein VFG69_03505 [Nannocystaceae bacterium]|nr:hypothetical protein [Nannocystaceae bacterium]